MMDYPWWSWEQYSVCAVPARYNNSIPASIQSSGGTTGLSCPLRYVPITEVMGVSVVLGVSLCCITLGIKRQAQIGRRGGRNSER